MRKIAVTGILVLIAVSLGTSVWAGPTTVGLTGVSCVVTGDDSVGYDYNFTVCNNSVDMYTDWNVLVAELNIYNVVAGAVPNLVAPTSVLSPVGWEWNTNGGKWKSNSFLSYDPISNGLMYYSPPSIAPGEQLSGFVLHYDTPFDVSTFGFETHVLAVLPLTGPPTVPQYYAGTTINLNSSIYQSKETGAANTWWDKPGDCDDGGGTPNEVVPEASSVMLGALGLIAPMGYALKRRKASK